MSDRLLRKRLVLAKNNDQSVFDDRGNLVMLEEDSVEENNFFEVHAQIGTTISYVQNPVIF